MRRLLLAILVAILMVSSVYSIKINFNTSFAGKGSIEEKSSNFKNVKQENEVIMDSGVKKREKDKQADYVLETKFIYNEFPNREEHSKLNFIRDMMSTILGQTKFCNTSYHDNQKIEGSSSHQSCSCMPSCHEIRDCCPDIQHKLVQITHYLTNETVTNLIKPKPVCTTLHDKLYKQDISNISTFKMTNERKHTRRSKENSHTIKGSPQDSKSLLSDIHGMAEDNKGKVQDNKENVSENKENVSNYHGQSLDYSGRVPVYIEKVPDYQGKYGDNNQLLEEMESNFIYPQYLVIQSCPETYKNRNVVKKCLEDNPTLILDTIPVVDWVSNTIYRNKHCAACNNIKELIPWEVSSDCIELYKDNCPIITIDELKTIILHGKCKAIMMPRFEMEDNLSKCRSNSNDVIENCNKTGSWLEHNSIIEKLCKQPDMIAHFLAQSGTETLVYKNMFCYLCNQPVNENFPQKPVCYNETFTEVENHNTIFPNFEVIMHEKKFMEIDKIPKSCRAHQSNTYQTESMSKGPEDCKQDETWDVYQNTCHQLICPLYQTPYQQLCIPKQSSVRGLVISAQLLVTLPKDSFIMVGSDHVSNSEDSFVLLLNSRTDSIQSSNAISLKYFFQEVYKSIETILQFNMHNCNTKHIRVLAKSQQKKMKNLIFQVRVQNDFRCSVETLVNMFREIETNIKAIQSPDILQQNGIATINIRLEYNTLSPENFNIKQTILNGGDTKAYEVSIQPLFYCPRIKLSLKEYQQAIKEGIIDELNTYDFDLQFKPETKTVDVCLLTYLKQWLKSKYDIPLPIKVKSKNGIESTMSMVATLTSMISTVVVLITYSIFSELRFVPGKLFMILCVNLLLAQFFFAFGSNDGYSDSACKFIGISIHFFWLATIFSMSSCLSLMIHSIKSPMEHNNRVLMQSKSICKASKYVLIIYCAPLLMVIINFVMASVKKAPYQGYGGNFCYISTNTLRIYTFAIPVGIAICTNFTMFAMIFTNLIIVIKSNQKSNHQSVLVFLKLTTITGMFWIFGFLYEATQIVYFAYLFTILNAGQGFFLMWSFILNKRVINLYISKIKKYSNTFHSWNISNSTGQHSSHKKMESIDPCQLAQSDQD